MVHATRCQGNMILLNLLSEGATLFVVHVVVLDPLERSGDYESACPNQAPELG